MRKVALITGGGRGIGLGHVKQLASEGYAVVATGTESAATYQATFEEIRNNGGEVTYLQSDVSVAKDRQECVEKIIKKYGRIDVLVNNAGVAPLVRTDILDVSEESWDRVMGINLKGAMFLTQLVAKQMMTQELIDGMRGIIINTGSLSSYVSSANRVEYCVSKAGVSMLTIVYGERLAEYGIFVYEVRPGVIATDMTKVVTEKYTKLIADGQFPIARWGQPEDVALAVSMLCEGKLKYTTGQVINVDGAYHIRRM